MAPNDLTDATLAPLSRWHVQIIRIFEISPVDGATLWWCSDNQDRTFRGNLCKAMGSRVKVGKVSKKTSPEVDRMTVNVGDDDTGIIAQKFLDGDLDGISLTVYETPVDALEEGDGRIFYRGKFYAGSYSNGWLSIDLKGQTLNDRRVPARKFTKACPWIFKGTECGYSGAETECNKTLSNCKARSNTSNFGGIDGPPSA